MIRTQISLDPDQRQMLAMLSSARDKSMSELVREALDSYMKYHGPKYADKVEIIKRLTGAWATSPNWKNVNASTYQRKLRREKGI